MCVCVCVCVRAYACTLSICRTLIACPDIFAVIGRGLYGGVDPDRFGNIAQACFTLFQLMTLDDWFVMYSNIRDNHPGTLLPW